MKLIITEKPSVAMTIGKVLGARQHHEGYLEGNGYQVSWCVGHLVSLVPPECYDEKYQRWEVKDLPLFPQIFGYQINKSTKKQFYVLKRLMKAKDVTHVVNACDAGREGELIFRLVYQMATCQKPIKRLWLSSLEEKTIRDGMSNLKEGQDYQDLFESALARSQADWLVGMNLSRLYSCLYQSRYSVGRVQTPTLALIVNRDETIRSFRKELYYKVELNCQGLTFTSERLNDKAEASSLLQAIPDKLTIQQATIQEMITKPERLLDLTTLQRLSNQLFGLSAKETLDVAQNLYEKKWLTYPRTDSRYLNTGMEENVKELLASRAGFQISIQNMPLNFDNDKVSDHHAILPTLTSLGLDKTDLSETEVLIYQLVFDYTCATFSEDLIEETVSLTTEIAGHVFQAKGKVVKQEGYLAYLQSYQKKRLDYDLSHIQEGQVFPITRTDLEKKGTQPPQPFTEATLLKAMEHAGVEALDKSLEIERQGLGTSATRAAIIEQLISKELITREKKSLKATSKEIALVTVVADFLKDPETTANWENRLSRIALGQESKAQFLRDIEQEVTAIVGQYQTG